MEKMTASNPPSAQKPFCGADLERWRLENGLSKALAADAFGLPYAKYEQLISLECRHRAINDPLVAMLLELYSLHPQAAPVEKKPNLIEFYDYLGFKDSRQNREMFVTLIGRSATSAYRLLDHKGAPGSRVLRWIEAIQRMNLNSKKTLKLMVDVATRVGERRGVENVLINGWSQQADADVATDSSSADPATD
jgi:hypothetical protein